MQKTFVAALLSAAVGGVMLSAPLALHGQPAAAGKPADKQAADPAQFPVRQVVLYSSGVGYFEHFGTVQGNGATELRFKTQQINDILKSLVLQDMDKGNVGAITYPSLDPVAKTLKSFQIDITANPGVAELLGQLRGAKVQISVGAESLTGTVLGVEKKPRPVGSGNDATVVDVWFVNLITDAGIRSISLDEVRGVELQDPKLKEELRRALAALASARDQDTKPVQINFQGEGERRIRIGYVVETPVWKTSYRLILSPRAGAGKPEDEKPGTEKRQPAQSAPDQPAPGKPAGAAAGAADAGGALQGWAIVENQTDNDWTDVQLSLVSGRPISFIMDLYQPLYIPRPTVQPELYASLRPQTYDAGLAERGSVERFGQGLSRQRRAAGEAESLRRTPTAAAEKATANRTAGGVAFDAAPADKLAAIDPSSGVASVASAAKVGELFQYTVGNVSLPRQTSAMIPVVTDAVEVEKLSIYNMNVLPKNPLLGARVKNTTDKHLLQGPITVLDEGAYVGDARIDDLPPSQERLISYGVDQQIIVQAQNGTQNQSLMTGKIVKGVLHLTYKQVATQDYVADNKGDKAKTLVIEHARYGSDWKLKEPAKADETTDAVYRFKGKINPGGATKLTVVQELTRGEAIEILPMDSNAVVAYMRTGAIPREVRDALAKAAELKQALVGTDRQIREKQAQINQISQEQIRIRDNMKTVAQNTEYYAGLLNKLGEQETQIEGLQKDIANLRTTMEQQRKALEDYLNGLNVG